MTAANVSSLDERRTRVLGAVQLVRRYSTATGTARSVLNVLATYADTDGRNVFVGRTRLERETGLSRSTLRRAIRKLEDLGEVETLSQGAGRDSSRYRITLSPPVGNPVDNPNVPERERVQSEPGAGSECTRTGFTVNPNREVPVITGEGSTFPDHCPAHARVEDPPPCRKCQRTRETNDDLRREQAREARDLERRRRLEESAAVAATERAAAVDPDTHRRRVEEIRATLRQTPPNPS